MNDETLIEAINDYSFYTAKQRRVLILMIKLAVDDVVTVGSKFLEEKAEISHPTMVSILKMLQQESIISRFRIVNTVKDSFKIHRENLDKIVKIYLAKKNI